MIEIVIFSICAFLVLTVFVFVDIMHTVRMINGFYFTEMKVREVRRENRRQAKLAKRVARAAKKRKKCIHLETD